MRIVTSKQMKQIEQNSIQYQMSYLRLMENAGCAAANFILQTLHDVSDLNASFSAEKETTAGTALSSPESLPSRELPSPSC